VPLLALLMSFDAIAGEVERGTLPLLLTYPVSRLKILLGKLLAHIAILALATGLGYGLAALGGDDVDQARLPACLPSGGWSGRPFCSGRPSSARAMRCRRSPGVPQARRGSPSGSGWRRRPL
jgi:hypothetical protein